LPPKAALAEGSPEVGSAVRPAGSLGASWWPRAFAARAGPGLGQPGYVPPASQEPVPADLAGAWTRVGARLLDYLFVHLGLLAVSAVLDLSLGFPDDGGYALTVLAVLVVYETAFLYNRGQTLAKLLLGLRVIRADRAPLSLGDALKRSGIVGALGLVPFGLLDGDGAGPAAPGPARQGGPDAGRQHQATPKALLLGMNRCPTAPLRLAAVGGPPLPHRG
jgi:uncharacterized RDD family membrane protein YckC